MSKPPVVVAVVEDHVPSRTAKGRRNIYRDAAPQRSTSVADALTGDQ